MANTFPNAKNQHLKNYVPVWTKKEMTDAAPNDYIDISWVDTEDDLVYDEKKLVTTETIKKLDQKITDNLVNLDERVAESIGNLDGEINQKLDEFKQKADEIVEKAVEHHIEDVKKVKEIASTLKKAIDDETARAEQSEHELDLRVSNNNRLATQALARVLDEEKARKEDIEVVNNTIVEKENNLATMISGIHHELATEMTQRELADNKFQTALDKEIADRETADTDLYNKVERETNGKIESVRNLITAINTKVTNDISNANSRIDEEISNREIADNELKKKLTEKDTHLEWLIGETDSKLSANIESESKYLSDRLEGLIGGVASRIDTEKANREAADEEIKNELKKATGEDGWLFQILCDAISENVIELQKKSLTSVEITIDGSNGEVLVENLPPSAFFTEFKYVKNAGVIPTYFHPEVTKLGDNNEYTVIVFFDKDNGEPEDIDIYKNITATYTCPIIESIKG